MNVTVYNNTLLYLFRLCSSEGHLGFLTATALADFQFQMLPRLSGALLYTDFNPEMLRENVSSDSCVSAVRPADTSLVDS